MVQQAFPLDTPIEPDIDNLVTEDDAPVDNWASEKHQRLLSSSLYSSWQGKTFLVAANVGIYHTVSQPAIVPDVFLSLNVTVPDKWWEKKNRCYLVWQFGKPPEVVIEIVSNKVGDELGNKLRIYEQMRVSYYVVFDPIEQLEGLKLRIYELKGMRYFEMRDTWLEQVELGLTLWEGEFEGKQDIWLRWCDRSGNLLLTGDEQLALERQEKEQQQRRAEQAEQRAEKLAEQLRALGINPDTL